MSFVYTDEHVDYIKEVSPGRYNDEIAEMFNHKFNLNKSAGAINSMKKNHGIISGKLPSRPNYKKRIFTKEQERFLFKNAKGLYNQELTDLVNQKFNLNISMSQIKS